MCLLSSLLSPLREEEGEGVAHIGMDMQLAGLVCASLSGNWMAIMARDANIGWDMPVHCLVSAWTLAMLPLARLRGIAEMRPHHPCHHSQAEAVKFV